MLNGSFIGIVQCNGQANQECVWYHDSHEGNVLMGTFGYPKADIDEVECAQIQVGCDTDKDNHVEHDYTKRDCVAHVDDP